MCSHISSLHTVTYSTWAPSHLINTSSAHVLRCMCGFWMDQIRRQRGRDTIIRQVWSEWCPSCLSVSNPVVWSCIHDVLQSIQDDFIHCSSELTLLSNVLPKWTKCQRNGTVLLHTSFFWHWDWLSCDSWRDQLSLSWIQLKHRE